MNPISKPVWKAYGFEFQVGAGCPPCPQVWSLPEQDTLSVGWRQTWPRWGAYGDEDCSLWGTESLRGHFHGQTSLIHGLLESRGWLAPPPGLPAFFPLPGQEDKRPHKIQINPIHGSLKGKQVLKPLPEFLPEAPIWSLFLAPGGGSGSGIQWVCCSVSPGGGNLAVLCLPGQQHTWQHIVPCAGLCSRPDISPQVWVLYPGPPTS